MDRRAFLAFLPTAVSFPFLAAGCGSSDKALRVGYHPWIGYETLYLVEQLGWLPAGVHLRRLESASAQLDALRAGQLDAVALTLDEVIRVRESGLDLVVVLVFDVSSGADVLMASDRIQSLDDLAGKRIGYEPSAVSEMLLSHILERVGWTQDDVVLVERSVDRHLASWRAGEVDALVTYEPTASVLREDGMNRLIDSRSFPDMIFDVLAVRREVLGAMEDSVESLIAAHYKGLHHLRHNGHDAMYRIAGINATSEEVVRWSLAGVLLPNLDANRHYLHGESRLHETARQVMTRFFPDDRRRAMPPPHKWITADFLPLRTS